ncbi:MAG: hypothetical protein Q4C55_09555 [Eubacterium sp.]|nr:hypothetical protein [Eubacterium sp.]
MGKYYEKRTLIEALQKQAEILGRTPTPDDMIDPPAKAYFGFFKKWEKALKAANLSAQAATKTICKPVVSEPKAQPKAEAAEPSVTTDTAPTGGKRRYSKAIITQMLLDEFKRLGKKPTRKEIDANKNLPTVATCLNYFGTTRIGDVWDEILKDM